MFIVSCLFIRVELLAFACGAVPELVFLASRWVIEFVFLEHDLSDDTHVSECFWLLVLVGLPVSVPEVLIGSEHGVSLVLDHSKWWHAARNPVRCVKAAVDWLRLNTPYWVVFDGEGLHRALALESSWFELYKLGLSLRGSLRIDDNWGSILSTLNFSLVVLYLLRCNSLRFFGIGSNSFQKNGGHSSENTSNEWSLLESVSSYDGGEVIYDGEAGIKPRDMIGHKGTCTLVFFFPIWSEVFWIVNISKCCFWSSPPSACINQPAGNLYGNLDGLVSEVSETLLGSILGIVLANDQEVTCHTSDHDE